MNALSDIPPNLPAPQDDGAAAHLPGIHIPSISLKTTTGAEVDLSSIPGLAAVFAYPRTGKPDQLPLVPDWDTIPGARGCTPEVCSYRDLAGEFEELGVELFGLSTQTTEYQKEMAERLHVSFPVLSDSELRLARALPLPTFEVAGQILLKRLSWVQSGGVIVKVFYPVFPPDKNADEVLHWIATEGF